MSIFKKGDVVDYANSKEIIRPRFNDGNSACHYRLSGNLVVVRHAVYNSNVRGGPGSRGTITEFSEFSRRSMRRYLRECTSNYSTFITLTYSQDFPASGAESKEHLRRFLQELSRLHGRGSLLGEPFSCFWFLEFQKRGAPHYHLLTNFFVPKGWLSSTWARVICKENPELISNLEKTSTNVKSLKGPKHAIAAYAMKYANKATQKEVPVDFKSVGRFWGVAGCRTRVVADCFFEPRLIGEKNVKQLKKTLDDRLTSGVADGRIKILFKKTGVRLLIIENVGLRLKVYGLINELNDSLNAARQSENDLYKDFLGDNEWLENKRISGTVNLDTSQAATVRELRAMLQATRDSRQNQLSLALQKDSDSKQWGCQDDLFQ